MLSEFGADLSEWLENGRVRALLELVDQLPSTSRLTSARMNDPDEAERIARAQLEHGTDSNKWHPDVSEYELTHKMLGAMISLQQQTIKTMVELQGGKGGSPEPFPAPRTAVHDAIDRLEAEWADNLLTAFGFDPGEY